MNKIDQEVKIIEVKKVSKVNKKNEKTSDKSIKLLSENEKIIITLKGEYAKNFNPEDRGLKADFSLNFNQKQKKINEYKKGD